MDQQHEFNTILHAISQYAQSDLGAALVKSTNPCYSRLIIKRDSARLKAAMDWLNQGMDIELISTIDIHYELDRVRKGYVLTPIQLLKILKVSRGIIALRKVFTSAQDVDIDALDDLIATLVVEPSFIASLMKLIDDEGEIRHDASLELSNLYNQYDIVKSRFDRMVKSFLDTHAASLQEHFTTLRDGRLCVLVINSDKNKFKGYTHGTSASGAAVYIEPEAFVRYNNELVNIQDAIDQQINQLLRDASMMVLSHSDNLAANVETMALIDAIFAKARWGVDNHGCVAQLSDEKGYNLVNIRHPLLDQTKAVANTICCQNEKRVILITGANTAGKTVLLKTIGLAFMLMGAGIPVLADEAKLCLIDTILDDVDDQQSIIESLSTFSAHVLSWKNAIEHATERSLVLLDELGSGTDPKEGAALGQALLERLVDIGCLVVATTHFQSIKEYGLTQNAIIEASMEFDRESLKPTYRYIAGSLGTSYAFEIALQYGLDHALIDRAAVLKDQAQSKAEALIKVLSAKQIELDKEKEALQQQQQQLQDEFNKRLKALEDEKTKLQADYDALVETNRIALARSQQKLNTLINELKRKPENRRVDQIIHEAKRVEVEQPMRSLEPVNEGDYARLDGSNAIVKVVSIRNNKVDALLNGKTIHTTLKALTKVSDSVASLSSKASKKHQPKPQRKEFVPVAFDARLNLLGQTVEQGIEALGAFIDKALVANQKRIVVITGDGTGRLRTGIHDYLRRNRFVDHFELASRSEGATGATVIYLK